MRIIDDLKEFSNHSKKKMVITLLTNPNFHCVALYRLASLFYHLHLSVLSKMIWYFNRIVFSMDIDYRADLAGGFVVIHGIGLVIGCGVKSEGSFVVFHDVTIGGNNGRERVKSDGSVISQPQIGRNVTLYTGVKLFGPIHIGDNVTVGAGNMITKDIPENTMIHSKTS